MPTPYDRSSLEAATRPAAPGVAGRPPLTRPVAGRRLGGVCAGIARHLGVSVRLVRLLMVLLTVFGPGLVTYLFIWAATTEDQAPAAGSRAARAVEGLAESAWGPVVAVGVLIVLTGVVIGLEMAGVDARAGLLVPLLLLAGGAIVAWTHLDEARRAHWIGDGTRSRGLVWMRLALGAGLAVVGLVVLGFGGSSVDQLGNLLLAAVAVFAGVLIIGAPWALRLWSDFRTEQLAAARATERADIAAHLHDSVLQTLALIQRRAADPTSVAQLARAQERELRAWLYAGPVGSETTLASAATAAAHEVEDATGVAVDLVVTGDRDLEPHGAALVRALREALLNATRHGRPPVTAYVEIGRLGVEAYVRDRGEGFDLEQVPPDRLGVRGSILERMDRHGGSARVRRREDGTEVELRLPAPVEEDR